MKSSEIQQKIGELKAEIKTLENVLQDKTLDQLNVELEQQTQRELELKQELESLHAKILEKEKQLEDAD